MKYVYIKNSDGVPNSVRVVDYTEEFYDILKIPSQTKRKCRNLNSPDWWEHPAIFYGRCGRKAGI